MTAVPIIKSESGLHEPSYDCAVCWNSVREHQRAGKRVMTCGKCPAVRKVCETCYLSNKSCIQCCGPMREYQHHRSESSRDVIDADAISAAPPLASDSSELRPGMRDEGRCLLRFGDDPITFESRASAAPTIIDVHAPGIHASAASPTSSETEDSNTDETRTARPYKIGGRSGDDFHGIEARERQGEGAVQASRVPRAGRRVACDNPYCRVCTVQVASRRTSRRSAVYT
jgi:hypothetical protein